MNDDKNLLGRVLALALILGAAYGVHAIARGGSLCPFGGGSSCMMETPSALSPAETKAAPVEKIDAKDDGDQDAVSPAKPE